MRLVTVEYEGAPRVGVRTGSEGVILTEYGDMKDLIKDGEAGLARVRAALDSNEPHQGLKLLAPITEPGKILCSGINYAAHSEEDAHAKLPVEPSVFSKLPSSIIGPDEAIVIPTLDCQTDYEVELAFIIGKKAKNVSKADALDYIFGYTVMNDVSERARQFQLQHETIGKGVDTFCPIGPEIVLPDEVADPSQLRVRSYVNGELRQDAHTSQQIFSIPAMIEYLTSMFTLNPGDIVSTGTPAGCGAFMNPPQFLQPGDHVVVEVEGVGRLSNPVAAGWKA
ncbi:fumarylacetoacetate hydrolase family protein [Paenibacillus silvisoli]|uniref:fumarylacetoacetate hydrolase family protein n=1 Tax=Paenibacillus silvisoli TaxID=3110539 RepID=UPI00280494A3|nr:fumarylacetoacetate hydrolase family protein [Paenibacillus silvisoli]